MKTQNVVLDTKTYYGTIESKPWSSTNKFTVYYDVYEINLSTKLDISYK